MNYREDGMTPFVTIWKYGLTEMKVWIFQARRRWNIRHNTTWDLNVYVDKIKKHKGDRGFFCSYSLGETGLLLLNFLVIKRSYSFQVGREGGFFEQHFSTSSGFLFFDFIYFILFWSTWTPPSINKHSPHPIDLKGRKRISDIPTGL